MGNKKVVFEILFQDEYLKPVKSTGIRFVNEELAKEYISSYTEDPDMYFIQKVKNEQAYTSLKQYADYNSEEQLARLQKLKNSRFIEMPFSTWVGYGEVCKENANQIFYKKRLSNKISYLELRLIMEECFNKIQEQHFDKNEFFEIKTCSDNETKRVFSVLMSIKYYNALKAKMPEIEKRFADINRKISQLEGQMQKQDCFSEDELA